MILLYLQLNELDAKSEEAETAKKALFAKHPDMKSKTYVNYHILFLFLIKNELTFWIFQCLLIEWPKDHSFQVYKLDIEEIFMINFYGGPKPLTVDEYLRSGM